MRLSLHRGDRPRNIYQNQGTSSTRQTRTLAIIKHSHEQEHLIEWKQAQLFAPVKFWHQRRVREAIEIKAHNTVPQDIGFFINDIWSPLLKPTLPAAAHHNTDTLQRTHIQPATNWHASPDNNSFDPSTTTSSPAFSWRRAEYAVRNVNTKMALFRATTPSKEFFPSVVTASLLLIFIFIVALNVSSITSHYSSSFTGSYVTTTHTI